MLREVLQVLRSEYAFALITASLAVLLRDRLRARRLSRARHGRPADVARLRHLCRRRTRGVLSWAHTRGLLLRRCASAKNIKAMAAAVPHATSKAASTTLIATPTTSLDGLEAEVIDSQEQSRDDADSNSALVLT